ncbi:MAG: 50S ribosomal protein L3 [Candidatus Paceibacterota bacterium]|jgi:large subunit ribosomal protein L3|nr:50S ribosomal protein L3 [Candidatus Paceibacterota bacterium]HPD55280.1 50S ribosomal protein L3 [Candidatus Paceibacterota bacterium]HQM34710.1 50S ribosomal protein L3 [Candidatus Paceibacterota bacterium]
MTKFILAQKIGMTQIYQDDKAIPVTALEAGPVVVSQIKKQDRDGYYAIQVGFGKKRNLSKAVRNHLKGLGDLRWLKECKITKEEADAFKRGDRIDVSVFKEGEKVKIIGTSKAKGFQGVVKRHGFHGGPKSHGQKDRLRAPGSIGATHPQHVLKGKKMAGRMGGNRITLKNVKIVKIIPEKNIICVKGAIPGKRGELVQILSE